MWTALCFSFNCEFAVFWSHFTISATLSSILKTQEDIWCRSEFSFCLMTPFFLIHPSPTHSFKRQCICNKELVQFFYIKHNIFDSISHVTDSELDRDALWPGWTTHRTGQKRSDILPLKAVLHHKTKISWEIIIKFTFNKKILNFL